MTVSPSEENSPEAFIADVPTCSEAIASSSSNNAVRLPVAIAVESFSGKATIAMKAVILAFQPSTQSKKRCWIELTDLILYGQVLPRKIDF